MYMYVAIYNIYGGSCCIIDGRRGRDDSYESTNGGMRFDRSPPHKIEKSYLFLGVSLATLVDDDDATRLREKL